MQSVEEQGIKLGVPITLNVGGFLVIGFVITGREYFEEFSRIVANGLPSEVFDDEGKESITSSFRNLRDLYQPAEESIEGAVARGGYNFVHLRDAAFIHPGGERIPYSSGLLWRTKLDAIDGFTLGLLTPVPEEESEANDEPKPDE